ncbi:SCO family protein [Chelatococcus asaccharovorans]|uniref:Protein SCO1/2 n=1 Tax=Chelatococcus asaccharovorans TaxID=28210 RepID=A0A2V3U8K7_9HYPH|nr:SCO family protein [Chelatococcus asaccharovorans]MBS7705560.1 SCO family protein [Chelatococcus asaccharovorans]PXW60031.1 protein SCO1/2 [Chelatococcus asaccharovorans]CAH1656378.1 putative Cytochrome oxidase biogenesis protein Sco1/SenC/PrrC, copper metallochaperone [Chelatococcus asaccharovorans]CAH1685129.1 putative Cytochrome oxidase biogenesis protein Sco1/SenC/PrrC, copper metallochaperone [Chelatococcus asaccharovorans]
MKHDRLRRLALPLLTFLVSVVLLGIAIVSLVDFRREEPVTSSVGGPFTLTSQDGRTVTEKDLRGAPFLVFFGFTHCPDVCPTTLFEASELLRAAGSQGDKLRILFVTVDPERDTPEVMKSYLSAFDPRIIGLSGSPEAIAAIVKSYKVYARKVPTSDGYTMDHTAMVYLMDAKGRFVNGFDLKRAPDVAAKDLLSYL